MNKAPDTLMNKVENINLIRKMAWTFFLRTDNIDFDELFSEAALAYYEALEKYDPNKSEAKATTYAYTCMKNALGNFCTRQQRDTYFDDIPEYSQPIHTPSLPMEVKESAAIFFNQFSQGAREVIEFIVNPENQVNPDDCVRGKICDGLRQKGWKWQSIWDCMSEIKLVLKN